MEFPIRINKYIAQKGLASRREADQLIADGKILINGAKARIGQQVEKSDEVVCVGAPKAYQYLAYYKACGIVTHSPEEGQTDVATKLKEMYQLTDVHPVGRLDRDSEGLLILSNDGRITAPLLDPNASHEKQYEVVVDKKINHWFIKHMENGVDIEGYVTKPAKAEKKTDYTFLLSLTEGKKHQIRRMCAALGYQVQSLKRVRILNITLGKLKPNQYRVIEKAELNTFLKTLSIK